MGPERGTKRARDHMGWVAQLSCICCGRFGVECHHPIHGRFAQRRASDLDVIPLCWEHHRMLHEKPAAWRAIWGMDVDHIEPVRRAVETLKARSI